MSNKSITTTMRNCATCRRWTGTAIPNAFCSWVEIDVHETGKCRGVTYHMCSMYPMQSCSECVARW